MKKRIVKLNESQLESLINKIIKEEVYINESLLDKYGEMVGRFLDKYGEAMEKMGFGKFIDKYGQKIDDKFGDFVMSCGRTIDDFIEEVHNKFKTKLKEVNQQSEQLKEEGEERSSRYMFFSNLEQIHRQAAMLLEMDENTLEQILDNGHDWAQDHVSEAKNNMDQVFDFIMNKIRD